MSDLFVTRENKYKFRNFQALESSILTNSIIWNRNHFQQGTSNMEHDPGKIKDIGNIKQT